MTLKKFLEDIPHPEMIDFVAEGVEIWSNAACSGYCRAAAEQAKLSESQTRALLESLEELFDKMSLEEAEKVYFPF